MKAIGFLLLATGCSAAIAISGAAAAFINLGFDTPEIPEWFPSQIPGPPFGRGPGEWIRPGWDSYPQSGVGYNYTQSFSGLSSLLDTNFRDSHFGANTPVPVVGNYSLGIWPPNDPIDPGVYDAFFLWQTGDIPSDALSLRFLYHGNDLQVFVGGEVRPLYALPDVPTGDPEIPVFHYYAVDVSPYAGQTVELRFQFRSPGYDDFGEIPRRPGEPNAQSHVLDDLSFSPLPAVPEPSTWALLGLGALSLTLARRTLGGRGKSDRGSRK